MSKSPEGRDRIPDGDDTAEVPLTMAASMILTNLPRDATKALQSAGDLGSKKSMYMREQMFDMRLSMSFHIIISLLILYFLHFSLIYVMFLLSPA